MATQGLAATGCIWLQLAICAKKTRNTQNPFHPHDDDFSLFKRPTPFISLHMFRNFGVRTMAKLVSSPVA
jgi:hypothetical protein